MDKKDFRDLKWFFFFLTAFFIFLPKLINLWMIKWHITTGPGLGNAEWLGFWGSYIGSILGVMATLLAFLITYIQNRNQHHQTQKMLGEQLRLSVMPLLDLQAQEQTVFVPTEEYDCLDFFSGRPARHSVFGVEFDSERLFSHKLMLTISNVGQASAFQPAIVFQGTTMALQSIPLDTPLSCILNFRSEKEEDIADKEVEKTEIEEFNVIFDFQDIIGTAYRQTWRFSITYSNHHSNCSSIFHCEAISPLAQMLRQ